MLSNCDRVIHYEARSSTVDMAVSTVNDTTVIVYLTPGTHSTLMISAVNNAGMVSEPTQITISAPELRE